MIVDIEDEFRVRGSQRIEEYWYWMEDYVLKRTKNIHLKYEFRVRRPRTISGAGQGRYLLVSRAQVELMNSRWHDATKTLSTSCHQAFVMVIPRHGLL
jgi:hypothetical protein